METAVSGGDAIPGAFRSGHHLVESCFNWAQPLRHSPQVLHRCRHEELIVSAVRAAQSQSVQLQDALEVGKQDFDLLAVLARLPVGGGRANRARLVARRFMDAASNLAAWGVRTASWLQWTLAAGGLAGVIDDGIVFGDARPWALEGAPVAP